MSTTFAEALVANIPDLVEEQKTRAENRAKHLANQRRYELLEEVANLGPVGRDTVAYIRRYRGTLCPADRDLAALLSVREWTTCVSDNSARFLLLQQQRRVANLLGIRQTWEEAIR